VRDFRPTNLCVLCISAALPLFGCHRRHVPVETVDELPYPACAAAGPRTLVAEEKIRSGPISREQKVVETYRIERASDCYVFTGRQEWPMATADIEVVYDARLAPLRAWKRMTIPGTTDGRPDIRSYELRTPEVTIKHRSASGEVKFEVLKVGGHDPPPPGARVGAVVGPGRGLLTMWIRRENLAVGEKTYELVLDFREAVETLETEVLAREVDEVEPDLGKTVRVYTFYGRESVFTDETGLVVGDVAGMRPSAVLTTPEPEPMPLYGRPDPVHTP
jgi:hypothetical protein